MYILEPYIPQNLLTVVVSGKKGCETRRLPFTKYLFCNIICTVTMFMYYYTNNKKAKSLYNK